MSSLSYEKSEEQLIRAASRLLRQGLSNRERKKKKEIHRSLYFSASASKHAHKQPLYLEVKLKWTAYFSLSPVFFFFCCCC